MEVGRMSFVFTTSHLQPYSICDKELDKLD